MNVSHLTWVLTKKTSGYSFGFPGPWILGMDVPC